MVHSLPYKITDILNLCGIDYSVRGSRTNTYVDCPFCGTKKKMNINFEDDVFSCPKCGKSGGMLDLYSLLTDVPRENANKDIISKLEISLSTKNVRKKPHKTVEKEKPVDFVLRDKIYRELLRCLKLSEYHRNVLKAERHLSDKNIERYLFRSVPMFGYRTIANAIHDKYNFDSEAGFFINEDSWDLNFNPKMSGIIIPAFSVNGLIKGLHIRLDKPIGKARYIWLTSDGLSNGTTCNSPSSFYEASKKRTKLLLTEGEFKAITVCQEWNLSAYSICGVNNQADLKSDLNTFRQMGYTEIVEALDADYVHNKYVAKAKNDIKDMIIDAGYKYTEFKWDIANGKGIDDYIFNQKNV